MNYKYISQEIKSCIETIFVNLNIKILRYKELLKFKDQRRTAIFREVRLTSDEKLEVDNVYKQNYGHKIPYTWHRHFTAFTGNFDPLYFPEMLYIPEFEYFMNYNKDYCACYSDKNILPIIAKSVGVRTPDSLVSCMYGVYHDGNGELLSRSDVENLIADAGELFVKPSIDSCSGHGCRLINMKDGVDLLTNESCNEILSSLGQNFVVQHRIKCHPSISNIYSHSVNTFRIITYRWKNEVRAFPAIMRIGQGGKHLDNAHAGGMFIAVSEDGTLHEKAFTEFKQEYLEHPDTHLKFKGHKIINFEMVVQTAKKMHYAMPQLGSYNWDFTIDEKGNPILIEANVDAGSVWLIEMAHGQGPFGKDTPEILRWIKRMKQGNSKYRREHLFGY